MNTVNDDQPDEVVAHSTIRRILDFVYDKAINGSLRLVMHPLNQLYNLGHLPQEVPHGITHSSYDG